MTNRIIYGLLLLFSLPYISKGEYGGNLYKLKIQTEDKLIQTVYVETVMEIEKGFYNDLIYLKKNLPHTLDKNGEKTKYLTVFKNCIIYDNTNKLLERILISTDRIVKLSILSGKSIDFSSAILNQLNTTDSSWLNGAVKRKIKIEGFLCEYSLFIHQSTSEADSLIAVLQKVRNKFPSYDKLSDQDENEIMLGDKLDQKQRQIVKQILGLKNKIVIKETCTC